MTPAQLRAARREFNWTQDQMAVALGISTDMLGRWANGHHRVHPCAARLIEYWNRYPLTRPLYSHPAKLRNC